MDDEVPDELRDSGRLGNIADWVVVGLSPELSGSECSLEAQLLLDVAGLEIVILLLMVGIEDHERPLLLHMS